MVACRLDLENTKKQAYQKILFAYRHTTRYPSLFTFVLFIHLCMIYRPSTYIALKLKHFHQFLRIHGCGITVPSVLYFAFWQVLFALPLPRFRVSLTLCKAMPWQGTVLLQLSLIASLEALVPLMFLNRTLLTSTADFCENYTRLYVCKIKQMNNTNLVIEIYTCLLHGVVESQ
jgi:hypothetical protein